MSEKDNNISISAELFFFDFFKRVEMTFCPENNLEFYTTNLYDYYTKNTEITFDNRKIMLRELKKDISTVKPSSKKMYINKTPVGERFGMLLMRFLNADFSDFYTAYNTFFFAYGCDNYSKIDEDQYSERNQWLFDSEADFIEYAKKWYDYVKKFFQGYQVNFRKCVDYIYNLNGDNRDKEVNRISKLRAFTLLNRDLFAIQNNYTLSLENITENFSDTDSNKSLSEILKLIEKEEIRVSSNLSYKTEHGCYSLCYRILELLVTRDTMPIKTCENDGKYFIPTHRIDEIYCDYKHLDGSTCKDVGAKKKYAQKAEQDPAISTYNKIYQVKIMRTRRNPDNKELKEQFENFKIRGTALKKAYFDGKINLEVYKKLMKIVEKDETNDTIEKYI